MKRLAIQFPALALLISGSLTGCALDDGAVSDATDDLSLVSCDRASLCDRGDVCLLDLPERDRAIDGFCSTGDRCNSSRDCPEGSLCRGGDGLHCMVVDRDSDRAHCPVGSVPGHVECAAGFEPVVVTREPWCETCELVPHLYDRCREADIPIDRCRALYSDLWDGIDVNRDTILERCRNAGYDAEQCHRLIAD